MPTTKEIGREYEQKAHSLLKAMGFSHIFWVNESGETKLPYDFLASRNGEKFYVEVRGTVYKTAIPFQENKIKRLQTIRNCRLLLINADQFKLMTLDEAIITRSIKVVSQHYIREYQRQRLQDPKFRAKMNIWKLDYYHRNKAKYSRYQIEHRAEQNKSKLRWYHKHKERYKKLCPICKKNYFWDVPASNTTKRFKRRQMCKECYLRNRIIVRNVQNGRIVDVTIPKEILAKL